MGIDRAAYKGLESSIVADKIMSIMVAIMKSAEETVNARIAGVRQALDGVASVKLDLSIDPLLAKLIIIPHIPHIRACAYNHTKPYENKEVMAVFEEAFR